MFMLNVQLEGELRKDDPLGEDHGKASDDVKQVLRDALWEFIAARGCGNVDLDNPEAVEEGARLYVFKRYKDMPEEWQLGKVVDVCKRIGMANRLKRIWDITLHTEY